MAFSHAAELRSRAFSIASTNAWSSFPFGSGNALTPFSRMHSANWTDLSPPVAFSAGALEQPAPIRAAVVTAASGRSRLITLHPRILCRVGVHGRATVIAGFG